MEFCNHVNILITCCCPLGSMDRPDAFKPEGKPKLLEDPTISKIAKQHSISTAQVCLKWCLQTGSSAIPKSVNPKRLAKNLAATQEPCLTDENLAELKTLIRDRRYLDGSFWAPEGSPHTLESLWDEGHKPFVG